MKKQKYELTEIDENHRLFFDNFVRFYPDSYAIQSFNGKRGWITIQKNFSDFLIKAHVDRAYAVAPAAPFYPRYYFLDYDFGSDYGGPFHDRVLETIERLDLPKDGFRIMTSPRYPESGNCHLALKLEDNGEPLPIRKGFRLLQTLVGDLCEVYPQPNKKFRLPLGHRQFLFEDDLMLPNLSWQIALNFLLKIEPTGAEDLRTKIKSDDPTSRGAVKSAFAMKIKNHRDNDDCRELLESGLKRYGTRFDSQWLLVCYYYRTGNTRDECFDKILRWLEKQHNGFSVSINRGDWQTVRAELTRQIKSAYDAKKIVGNRASVSPDDPAKPISIWESDLRWIAAVFPGDIVRQKKLFRLLRYCRANKRDQFQWIYIPYRAWHEIAGTNTYRDFIYKLEDRGLIECCWDYRHVENRSDESYPRKFKVRLPPRAGKIIGGGRPAADNYIKALIEAFGSSVPQLSAITGIVPQRFYEHFKSAV